MNAPDPLPNSDTAGLTRYCILDTPPEPAFDDLAQRAAKAFGTTMAAISFFERGESLVLDGAPGRDGGEMRPIVRAVPRHRSRHAADESAHRDREASHSRSEALRAT